MGGYPIMMNVGSESGSQGHKMKTKKYSRFTRQERESRQQAKAFLNGFDKTWGWVR